MFQLSEKAQRDKAIMDRIYKDFTYLEENGYEVVGVFLQGSQNYGLDIYTDEYKSDIDTKAIVLPKFEDFCLNKKPVSETLTPWGDEHLDVKDVRLMFECINKANINFTEILFTEYYLINEKYSKIWHNMRYHREEIVKADLTRMFNACCGMAYEKRKALCHPYPTILHKIEKYGYDGKQLHHIIRMYDFITQILSGKSYNDALRPTDDRLQRIQDAKLSKYSLEDAVWLADLYLENLEEAVKGYKLSFPDRLKPDTEALNLLDTTQVELIKTYYKDYFKEA